jgi:UDP-N-acetylmuramoyl-L-alanyl-D-glutamate--2,6-diaminopimelate ligase
VIVVIGAAGERDPGKRAPLGEVAARQADLAIFTEEDSRSEDVDAILGEVAAGAESAGAQRGSGFLLEPDRRVAIRTAVACARPGDVVLLCGKGHEATLERSREILPWNEAQEALAALAHAGPTGAHEAR